jgi:hypothetical protein
VADPKRMPVANGFVRFLDDGPSSGGKVVPLSEPVMRPCGARWTSKGSLASPRTPELALHSRDWPSRGCPGMA